MLKWSLPTVALIASGMARIVPAAALPPLPKQASSAPMATQLRVNGLPMEIRAVATPWDPSESCARIVERWSRSGHVPLLRCRWSGGWLLASACVGTREWTVQLRAAPAGSRGYLSGVDLATHPLQPPAPSVPLLPGSLVRGVLESSAGDAGSRHSSVRQYTITLQGDPVLVVRRLVERGSRLGWQVTTPPASRGGPIEWRRAGTIARGFVAAESGRSGLVLVEAASDWRAP
jgi:hypothetical protein